jgi:hypothetical protein
MVSGWPLDNEAGRVGDDVAEAACHVYGTADHLLNLGGCQCVDASGRCRQGRIVGRSDSNREGLSLNGDTKKQRGNGHCETHDLRPVVAGEAELYLLTWNNVNAWMSLICLFPYTIVTCRHASSSCPE